MSTNISIIYRKDNQYKNGTAMNLATDAQLHPSKNYSDYVYSSQNSIWDMIFSWRSLILFLLHFSNCINIIPGVTMSMALVCMCGPVEPPTNRTLNHTGMSIMSAYTVVENVTLSENKAYEFNWDVETRGLLITAYLFTVFVVPQLCNIIRHYIGDKLALTFFSTILAFICFISPLAARTNVNFLLATRILLGLCINANFPISGDVLAWWIPVSEKLTSATIVTAGLNTGAIIGPLISGYLCAVDVDNGWPLIFYFNGIIVAIWTVAWFFLSSSKPENHPFISEKEKAYIIAHRIGVNNQVDDRLPYRKILTSRPVIAYLISTTCHLWSILVIVICLPLYLTSVLKFPLQEAGVVVSVMYGLRLPAVLLWSALGNWLLERKSMTTNKVRKICLCLGQGVASVFCIGVTFLDEGHKWVASFFILIIVLNMTVGMPMASVIPLDMAPRYAGFILGLCTSLSYLVAITAPLTVSEITTEGSFEEWRVVWIILAVTNFSTGGIFLVFGSASQQPWAVSETRSATNNVISESPLEITVKRHDSQSSNPRSSEGARVNETFEM